MRARMLRSEVVSIGTRGVLPPPVIDGLEDRAEVLTVAVPVEDAEGLALSGI
jgi:hypothetical protein